MYLQHTPVSVIAPYLPEGGEAAEAAEEERPALQDQTGKLHKVTEPMGVLMRKRGRVPSDFDGVIYSQVGGALIQRAVSGFAERKSDHWIRLLVGSRCIEQRRWEPELLSAYQRGFVFRIARLCE